MPTVHAAFKRVAARRGDAPLLVVDEITAASYDVDPGARTWREVAAEVERLRAAYERAGYGHGHRVGLLLENRPAFFTHWLALNALGTSIVPINAELRSAELIYLISHSEMSLAVAQPGREGALRAAATEANVHLDTIRPEVLGNIPRRDRRRASRASRSARRANARCSTPRAPPASRKAAVSPTATSCAPASGTSASAAWPRCCPTPIASSRRCRSAT